MSESGQGVWQKFRNTVGHSAELAISIALISVCITVGLVALVMNYSSEEPATSPTRTPSTATAPAAASAPAPGTAAADSEKESEAVEKMREQLSSTLLEAAQLRRREAEARTRQNELERQRETERRAAIRARQQNDIERRGAKEAARREAQRAQAQRSRQELRQQGTRENPQETDEDLNEILSLLEEPDESETVSARPVSAPSSGQLSREAAVDWDSCDPPSYPRASRRAGDEGVVVMRFSLDARGNVLSSTIRQSSGHERLDEAALSAISKCDFRPAEVNGNSVAAPLELRFTWRLE